MTTSEDFSGVRFQITVKGKAALANWDAPLWTDAQIRKLFEMHTPRLRRIALRLGVPYGDCDHVVTTLMDDVVVSLIHRQIVPGDLSNYFATALRNRLKNMHRDSRKTVCLDDSFPASTTTDDQPSDALARLAAACLTVPLTTDDKALVDGFGYRTAREVADDLNITCNTARVRLFRARHKMREAARKYLDTLSGAERSEVERFLRRAE